MDSPAALLAAPPPATLPAYDRPVDRDAVNALVAETAERQRRAADPTASAWVSANAGTGKTHVLTQRVLRLLLAGTPPARILCLTYTKAAAAEMSTRVFDTLATWIALGETKLTTALATLCGAPPDATTVARARTLFTTAIETPGGFKVQTIHAFAERLLQRFPLEAGVPPAFTILDETAAAALLRGAVDATLREAADDRTAPLGRALLAAVRYAADNVFDDVLAEAVAPRTRLTEILAAAATLPEARMADGSLDPFAAMAALLGRTFDVDMGAAADGVAGARTADVVRAELAALLDDVTIDRLLSALRAGTANDIKAADRLAPAFRATGPTRLRALAAFLIKEDGGARKAMLTKATATAHPELDAVASRAQERFEALDREAKARDVIEATLAVYRLADAVGRRFRQAKATRAALDFDDLITGTVRLLSTRESTDWVLYKLDGGVDHVLVDEAQDTAPEQWQIVAAIVESFFADVGAGGPDRPVPRTVFAVGDEKQSIYSFQGAAPHMLAAMGRRFEALATGAGLGWTASALTLSFRTVAPILDTVDATFANPILTPGIVLDGSAAMVSHVARRIGQAGLVEIWPTERPLEPAETDAWAPLEEEATVSPVARLARRIALTIRGWLDSGERLQSEDRPIRAGDVLILVRKRAPLAPAIVAALKAHDVPVAGSDRICLTRQIGVLDLMALGDVLTLPEDDLALAVVLKSPLFGLDDDDLLAIASGRRGTLWKALHDRADDDLKLAAVTAQLKRWRKQADFQPPYELYAGVLDRDGARMRMLERLGPEAADGLDEFMSLAAAYDDDHAPSLTGFLAWLREAERTIKRDMDQGRDEVRVLTVHGAKGLEAPIVILPDTVSTGSASNKTKLVSVTLPAGDSEPPEATLVTLPVWPVSGAKCLAPIGAAREAMKLAEAAELNRLLYVALTRPRDRLYICGVQSAENLRPGAWYGHVTRALADRLVPAQHPDGGDVLRLVAPQMIAPELPKGRADEDDTAAPRPAWASTPAPRERQPTMPFAPSRLAPYDYDAGGEPVPHAPATLAAEARAADPPADVAPPAPPADAAATETADARFLPGTLTHALLQHLPGLPDAGRRAAAEGYLARRGATLPAAMRARMVAETLALLADPTFAPLFGPDSRAEVPIVAELPDPSGRGPALKLTGQIDRLALTAAGEVLIVDYKTNRVVPADAGDVAEAYLLQLAAYRRALALVYPGRRVRAALLWTAVPRLMELPEAVLDHHGSRLWELASAKLDLAEAAS